MEINICHFRLERDVKAGDTPAVIRIEGERRLVEIGILLDPMHGEGVVVQMAHGKIGDGALI